MKIVTVIPEVQVATEAIITTNEATLNKLIEMHLFVMADAYRIQLNDSSMSDIAFEDRFDLLVDREYTSRKNNRLH